MFTAILKTLVSTVRRGGLTVRRGDHIFFFTAPGPKNYTLITSTAALVKLLSSMHTEDYKT